MLKTELCKLVCASMVALTASGNALAQVGGTVRMRGGVASTSNSRSHTHGAVQPELGQVSVSQPNSAARGRAVETYGKLPLSLEANQGQTDAQVKFLARGKGYTLFLTSNQAVLALQGRRQRSKEETVERHSLFDGAVSRKLSADTENPTVVAMRVVGANPATNISGLEELPGKSNYFIGNDPKRWRTDVPNYAKVSYQDVYPGVDLLYYGNQGRLEYDFVVAPGGDPKAIRLALVEAGREHKATPLQINRNGDLVVRLTGGEVLFHKPIVYQFTTDHGQPTAEGGAKHFIEAWYVLKSKGQVGIQIAPYDVTKALVVDPVLTYSSRLGGSGDDEGQAVAVDGVGNAYVAGTTASTDFPKVNPIPGTCQGTCGSGFSEAFVTKVNAAGNALIYSSYLGGSFFDEGFGIALDNSNNVYVTGLTQSADFPRVNQITGACVGACGTGSGTFDAFVTKINAAGNALVYSSLIGGSSDDEPFEIAVDGSGGAYLAGQTNSTDFPQVNPIPGACQGSCGTGSFPTEGFVTKVSAAGDALVYSSYLGGSAVDQAFGIAVDGPGNAYVTGFTQSADFPRVNQIPGACLGTCGTGANSDGFVTKINAAGSALTYSSLFGGSNNDEGQGIALDNSGNTYLTGSTASTDFPQLGKIPRACKGTCGSGNGDAFVTKVNSGGNTLVYSSFIGGSRDDEGRGIAVDGSGNAYVTGFTESANFPQVKPISGACVGTCGSGFPQDAFVIKINAAGQAVVYSSFIGGSNTDEAFGIAVDGSGAVYLTGITASPDFPTVNQIVGACQGSCGSNGNQEAFVLKIK
jgi:Beta-propeller repeat